MFKLGIYKKCFNAVLDLLYPEEPVPTNLPLLEEPFCITCGEAFPGMIHTSFSCSNCQNRQWAISRARSPYLAQGYVREVIHQFKYNRRFYRLPLLTTWLEEGYHRFYLAGEIDVLVPVPLHKSRLKWRGFNQAEEMGKMLSKKISLPVWNGLHRIRKTQIQTYLQREERLQNLEGAFAVHPRFDFKGKKVLLLDDVFTTGATADACARALREAGAKDVAVLTVARG